MGMNIEKLIDEITDQVYARIQADTAFAVSGDAACLENLAPQADLMIADPDFAAFIASDPERFPCESATEWIPFMYAQRNWKINAGKGGPHRMVMTWEGADPEKMISGALEQCRAAMKDQKGSRPQNLSYYWRSSLAETALQMKKKKLPAMETEIDLDELLEGRTPESYRAYLAGYRPAEAYRLLEEETGAAPAAPEDGED